MSRKGFQSDAGPADDIVVEEVTSTTKDAEEPTIETVEPAKQAGKAGKKDAAKPDDIDLEVVGEILLPERERTSKFKLRFSPYAWTKLRWIRDYKHSEIAGFGISSVEDPFYMEDFQTVKQTASSAHFVFDDNALNDFMADQFEAGKQPGECMRLWVHTHPTKDFAAPSSVDESTFKDAFGSADWAMMIIVDEGDNVYARLRICSGVSRLQLVVPSTIDCQPPFKGVSEEVAAEWKAEADANISAEVVSRTQYRVISGTKRVEIIPQSSSEMNQAYREQYRHHADRRYQYGSIGQGYGDDGFPPRRGTYSDPVLHGFDPMAEHASSPLDMDDANDPWESIGMLLMHPDRVVQITTDEITGAPMVCLEHTWVIYDHNVELACKVGDRIMLPTDLAEEPPLRCGELVWKANKAGKLKSATFMAEVIDGYIIYYEDGEGVDDHKAVVAASTREMVEENDMAAAAALTGRDKKEGTSRGPKGP